MILLNYLKMGACRSTVLFYAHQHQKRRGALTKLQHLIVGDGAFTCIKEAQGNLHDRVANKVAKLTQCMHIFYGIIS